MEMRVVLFVLLIVCYFSLCSFLIYLGYKKGKSRNARSNKRINK